MPQDARVDQTIAAAQPFARPILENLRVAVHAACPAVEETIKWGRPFFTVGGRPLAFMAAFKAHAAFGFWQGTDTGREAEAAGQFGRLTSVGDLPAREELIALIRKAAEAAAGPRAARQTRPEAEVPHDLVEALAASGAADACFRRLSPSHRREYVEWTVGAKRAETRARRIGKAITLLAEGKDMNGYDLPPRAKRGERNRSA